MIILLLAFIIMIGNEWIKVFMSGPCADFDVELPFKAVIAVLNVDQKLQMLV